MIGTRNSSLFGKITVLFVICCCSLSAHAKYGGGSGRSNNPYLIFDANQMNAIGADSNDWNKYKHFKLMADIDLSSITGTFNIIGKYYTEKPFKGVFDGNGHTISNFTHISTDTNFIGIFGYVTGVIKNLGLIDAEVDAGTGRYVGLLIGRQSGTITNCYVEGGSVAGDESVGGLVGTNFGHITKCYADCTVSVNIRYGGGLVGRSTGTITNCYSTDSVSGNECIGGLVGYNRSGTITNCYSTGNVFGNLAVGGLVGSYGYGTVLACFWDIQTSGQTTSAGGIGKTTDEMQNSDNFFVWGLCYGGIWTIEEGEYPKLAWEGVSGEPIGPYEAGSLYGGGTGEPKDPYLIFSAEQLNIIGLVPCDWDKHFLLMANIDLSCFTGTSFNIIGTYLAYWANPFTGVFDGNGHTISNFTYTSTDNGIGLFACVSGVIKNLGLIDPNVQARRYVGSLVGFLDEGTIRNCYADGGSVSGYDFIGGLVGAGGGTITNCDATSSVDGHAYAGGLMGMNLGTTSNSYANGSVSGRNYVGGLMGSNGGRITNSYSTASVAGMSYVGGMVGENFGTTTNCSSIGSVWGTGLGVGGLLG